MRNKEDEKKLVPDVFNSSGWQCHPPWLTHRHTRTTARTSPQLNADNAGLFWGRRLCGQQQPVVAFIQCQRVGNSNVGR